MIWVVVEEKDSGGWPEIISNEFRIEASARSWAENKSRERENLGKQFSVYKLVRCCSVSSEIVTKEYVG